MRLATLCRRDFCRFLLSYSELLRLRFTSTYLVSSLFIIIRRRSYPSITARLYSGISLQVVRRITWAWVHQGGCRRYTAECLSLPVKGAPGTSGSYFHRELSPAKVDSRLPYSFVTPWRSTDSKEVYEEILQDIYEKIHNWFGFKKGKINVFEII